MTSERAIDRVHTFTRAIKTSLVIGHICKRFGGDLILTYRNLPVVKNNFNKEIFLFKFEFLTVSCSILSLFYLKIYFTINRGKTFYV